MTERSMTLVINVGEAGVNPALSRNCDVTQGFFDTGVASQNTTTRRVTFPSR
jgi:hypothetical protein